MALRIEVSKETTMSKNIDKDVPKLWVYGI